MGGQNHKPSNSRLRVLNPNKAPEPNGISPRVPPELADILAPPLITLFQTSLDKGIVPKDWKMAFVCPLYKKGEKSLAANYRSINLTCVTSKIMEHILTTQLMPFAKNTDLFHTHQHGIRRNHGCEKQLIELTTDITNNLDNGQLTEACVIDCSKAFDKVNHNKLLKKLAHYGVSYQLIAWMEDFLSRRYQKVVVNREESTESPVTSGVPQGSVLGPVMFLFYINGLPDKLGSALRLIADDTIVYNTTNNCRMISPS